MTKHTLGFCLNRYPDELLYSLFGRYQDVLRYPSEEDLSKSLFGAPAYAVVDLPSHLDSFVNVLPSGHSCTIDQLIDEGTLLPLYIPFSRSKQIALVRNDMAQGNSRKIYGRLGILISQQWDNLKFCPLCVEDDRKKFDETYWHRLPQCPGVKVCPIHKVFLERSHINPKNERRRFHYFVAENEIQTLPARLLDLSNFQHITLLNIAQDISWLLSQTILVPEFSSLAQTYRRLLAERGFATPIGHQINDMTKLVNCFEEFYGKEFLQQLGCVIREEISNRWLDRILRTGAIQQALNPLYHLLLARFLGYSIKEFLNLCFEKDSSSEIKPFGDGPWPCLNHACNFFNVSVIEKYQLIRYKNGRSRPQPTGLFECKCGFSYYRIGPDKVPEDKFRYSGVAKHGEQWKQKFIEFWNNPDISLSKLIEIFRMQEKSLEEYAFQFGLTLPRQGSRGVRPINYSNKNLAQEDISDQQERYREELLKAISEYPNKTRTFFRKRYRKAFDFLYGYDKSWLDLNFPIKYKRGKKLQKTIRKDWEKFDHELAALVRDAVQSLLDEPSRPKRITLGTIGRKIGQSWHLEHNLSRLPLTKQSLDDSIETPTETAIRRIYWVMEQFQEEGILPSRSLFVVKAGFTSASSLVRLKEIQEAIDDALNKLYSMFGQN
jgi:hypothetical protein